MLFDRIENANGETPLLHFPNGTMAHRHRHRLQFQITHTHIQTAPFRATRCGAFCLETHDMRTTDIKSINASTIHIEQNGSREWDVFGCHRYPASFIHFLPFSFSVSRVFCSVSVDKWKFVSCCASRFMRKEEESKIRAIFIKY